MAIASDASSLQGASDEFYARLNTLLAGDPAPMFELWSHADDVTYMSPFGELLNGWDSIRDSWQQQADAQLGGRVGPADLHVFESSTLGVVVGFERGAVTVEGQEVKVNIRATSTYRLEDGHWKMIGHHTDPLS